MGGGRIPKSNFELRVIGCGDAFGSGGRAQTCFVFDDAQGRMALDLGASSLVAMSAQGIDPASIDTVFLTHLHGDHFGGVPYLLGQRQYLADTRKPLTIVGPPGFPARLDALSECLFPGPWRQTLSFPVDLIELTPGTELSLDGRRLMSVPVCHDAGAEVCTGVRIVSGDTVIGYSGDTGWTDALVALANGTDLFLCDCNDRHDQSFYGHMSLDTLKRHHGKLDTKRLVLTHLGPKMLACRDCLDMETAYDGMVIRL